MEIATEKPLETKYTYKDFVSNQEVRWCPGCGDYAVLNSVQKALPELHHKKEDYVFVSGIGCSSRFPYYMNTYGFHTLHGRAPAFATGVKLANPKLSVWEITGDGDALAIGGNHFIHAIRRNIDINILLFNNEIYGLTKGQYSPTSPCGLKTKSSPMGVVDTPFSPGEVVMGAGAKFFARIPDTDLKGMSEVFINADKFRGTSVVEILQNCVIFNDGAHAHLTEKDVREERMIYLKHGEKMIFGKDKNRGLVLKGLRLEAVTIGENGVTMDDILTHDAHSTDSTLHNMLIRMKHPQLPVAMGVVREVADSTYDEKIYQQLEEAKKQAKFKSLDELFNSGETWEVY